MKKYKAIIYDIASMPQLLAKELHQVQEADVPMAMVTRLSQKQCAELIDWDLKPTVAIHGFFFGRFGQNRKPKPTMLLMAAAQMGVAPEDVLSVCYNDMDIQASKAAGMDIKMVSEVREIHDLLSLMDTTYQMPTYQGVETIPASPLFGTICGDMIGIPYERPANKRTKDYHFEVFRKGSHFSDDTVLTLAIAEWLMGERTDDRLRGLMRQYGRCYPDCGFSMNTFHWIFNNTDEACGSEGNGSAMRVGAIGWAAQSLEEALDLAEQSAMVTHNTPSGVRGAQAVAAAIYLTRTGKSKEQIKAYIESTFGYDLGQTPEQIRPTYDFYGTCDTSVPQSICCWLYSDNYEQTIRNAVSLGGDADTIAAIAGSIAAATPGWSIPEDWIKKACKLLPDKLKHTLHTFNSYIA